MLNLLLALILMLVVILLCIALGALIGTFGLKLLIVFPFLVLYLMCYSFVKHMREG